MSYARGPVTRHWHSIDTITGIAPQSAVGPTPTWPTANLAIYCPVEVTSRVIVRKLWLATGATSAGNVDCGLYDASGVRLASAGSTAGVASVEMTFDVTDLTIGPGLYYLGIAADTNTDAFLAVNVPAPLPAAYGCRSEASAFPLPATATWVVDNAIAIVPVGGILLNTLVS